MTHREAGRLGAIASRYFQRDIRDRNERNYLNNPKLCRCCGEIIPYSRRSNTFCSHECAAKYNNERRFGTVKSRYESSISHGGDGRKYLCRNCNKLLSQIGEAFCSKECENEFLKKHNVTKKSSVPGIVAGTRKKDEAFSSIQKTGTFPSCPTTGETKNKIAKKYIETITGHKCASCGRSEINGIPIPLEVHHIDGDATNSKIENIQLLCPTCHAMTPTYKNRGARSSMRKSRVVLRQHERWIWSKINSESGGYFVNVEHPSGEQSVDDGYRELLDKL